MKHLLTIAILTLGCAGHQYTDDSGPSDEWCAHNFCMAEAITFTAVGEDMYQLLRADLDRYQAATGRYDLGTDPQAGIPVMWQEGLMSPSLDDPSVLVEACAQTVNIGISDHWRFTQGIFVDPTPAVGCPDPSVTLAHELIHAMYPAAKHVDVDSLFAATTGASWRPIDSAALARLCEGFGCVDFQPEE